MGAGLDRPKTELDTTKVEAGAGIRAIATGMQGYRVEMEDAHTLAVNVDGCADVAFAAIFDGHGGRGMADAAAKHLLSHVLSQDTWKAAKEESAGGSGKAGGKAFNPEHLKAALYNGFMAFDRKMQESKDENSGCTAVAAFITPQHIIIANCGDSRAVVLGKGNVVFHSEDHKPTNPAEIARIEKAGGVVIMRRVNGDLAVSRALGDFTYKANPALAQKDQQVSCEPDVTIIPRTPGEHDFLVLACDGVWDVIEHGRLAEYLASHAKDMAAPGPSGNEALKRAAEALVQEALDKGSKDNISALLVDLRGPGGGTDGGVAAGAGGDAGATPTPRTASSGSTGAAGGAGAGATSARAGGAPAPAPAASAR